MTVALKVRLDGKVIVPTKRAMESKTQQRGLNCELRIFVG